MPDWLLPKLQNDASEAVPASLASLRRGELLAAHGNSGFLIVRLQRYALLGWCGFALCALAFFCFALAVTLRPQAVLAVDEAGRVLGTFEHLDASVRSDEELIAAAKHFCEHYFSLNSHSIFEDYAAALTMMEDELMESTLQVLRSSLYLSAVRDSNTRSFLRYQGEPQILARRGLRALVKLKGVIQVFAEGGAERVKAFDVALDLRVVARTRHVTSGVQVVALRQAHDMPQG